MKAFETSIQRKKRTALTEAIEEVIDVPREYWEVMRSKQDNEVLIRQIYIYLLNKYVGYNHQMIADLCGLKHHTSVMRNLRVADVWIAIISVLLPLNDLSLRHYTKLLWNLRDRMFAIPMYKRISFGTSMSLRIG